MIFVSHPSRNIIQGYVLTKKTDSLGIMVWFKAHVVGSEFSQISDKDFKDTFAPTLKMVALPVVFSTYICTYLNLELHHLDIETTFLHGEVEEEIYME